MKTASQKTLAFIFSLLISASLLTTLTIILIAENGDPATVFVSPSSISVRVNQTFEVTINVSGACDLYGWEFKLSWNLSLLEAINITESSFLRNGADTYIVSKISNEDGYVLAGCTRLRKVSGASGNGTLATIEFQAKKEGTCTLNLYDTKLVNSNKQLMAHTSLDGTVHVLVHDIAITNIKSSKTIVGQGFNTRINITVENRGETSETFNTTAYANTTVIDTVTNIALTNGTTTTITFTWNTTGYAKGNYTISAYAWPVIGETDTEDNNCTDGWVVVTIPGDINGDGVVFWQDLLDVLVNYGKTVPPAPPNTDINNDNQIFWQDLLIVLVNYGKSDP